MKSILNTYSYSNEEYNSRQQKAIQQEMSLLKTVIMNRNFPETNEDDETMIDIIKCSIVNIKTNKVYTVKISSDMFGINTQCSCPDYEFKKNTCKHIYWLGCWYIGNIDPEQWSENHINTFLRSQIKFLEFRGRNDDCPICLEKINFLSENTICCLVGCRHSFHDSCWYKYYSVSRNKNCVMCRKNLF